MSKLTELKKFYSGKRVLLTGHTGFKGSWMSLMLHMLGAEVYGYSLEAPTEPSLYDILGLDALIYSEIGDIRNYEKLQTFFDKARPEVVFHLAAQPIVRTSYVFPRETYEINVMGTVNVLECARKYNSTHDEKIKTLLNVTTDKVYENNDEEGHAFIEDEKLDGYDPYSNSKSCSELVTHSYKKSFFNVADGEVTRISTARAGNVIGGGDFAKDRIIPDCVRDTIEGKTIHVRNPYSTRPYQHVLEPLYVYLLIAMQQAMDESKADYYNVGPDEVDAITTGDLADKFVSSWGEGAGWHTEAEADAPHEASFLKLDTGKLKRVFGWSPVWHVDEAVDQTVKWYHAWHDNENMLEYTEKQISEFLSC
ncbi:CDP-glucose 4,6-dehydratase [Oribacterium sp. WCC10]|uniref:CDP-glucose 4,6-dehydratase n=1 Tax=Oribacterium sp. WCC10 TaxID=1855343 RepID=UPI0008F0E5A0|nr:CDP-glucose 4,6-dehydratase [Oribacterium sp. WCC10]SFG34247.1 CDP-glucose 4,6-dehydratase [Oribacterium sp. WCC10]